MLLAFFIKIHFKINFWHLKNLILRVFLGSYSIFSFTLRETSCYDPRKHCMIWRFEILFEDLLQLSMWSSENHELPLDGQLHPMLQILHEYFSYGHQVPSLPFLQFSVKRLFSGCLLQIHRGTQLVTCGPRPGNTLSGNVLTISTSKENESQLTALQRSSVWYSQNVN